MIAILALSLYLIVVFVSHELKLLNERIERLEYSEQRDEK